MIHVEAGEGGMTLEQVNYIFVHEQQVFLINQQQEILTACQTQRNCFIHRLENMQIRLLICI